MYLRILVLFLISAAAASLSFVSPTSAQTSDADIRIVQQMLNDLGYEVRKAKGTQNTVAIHKTAGRQVRRKKRH